MSYEHKPFSEVLYCAKWENGEPVEIWSEYTNTYSAQDIIDSIGEDAEEADAMLYEAHIEWIPVTKIINLGDGAEPVELTGAELLTSKVERLQKAVLELLYEVNRYWQDACIETDTIEDYGLTPEDMQ